MKGMESAQLCLRKFTFRRIQKSHHINSNNLWLSDSVKKMPNVNSLSWNYLRAVNSVINSKMARSGFTFIRTTHQFHNIYQWILTYNIMASSSKKEAQQRFRPEYTVEWPFIRKSQREYYVYCKICGVDFSIKGKVKGSFIMSWYAHKSIKIINYCNLPIINS